MEISGWPMTAAWVVLMNFGLLMLLLRRCGPAGRCPRDPRQPCPEPVPSENKSQRGFQNYE